MEAGHEPVFIKKGQWLVVAVKEIGLACFENDAFGWIGFLDCLVIWREVGAVSLWDLERCYGVSIIVDLGY